MSVALVAHEDGPVVCRTACNRPLEFHWERAVFGEFTLPGEVLMLLQDEVTLPVGSGSSKYGKGKGKGKSRFKGKGRGKGFGKRWSW